MVVCVFVMQFHTWPTSYSSTSTPLLSYRQTYSSGKPEHCHVPLNSLSQRWIRILMICMRMRIMLVRWGDTGTSCSSSLLLAPLVERAGVLSSSEHALLEVTQSPLPRSHTSPYHLIKGNYVSDFTWLQGESCNIRINVRFPNMETISARVLYLHCTHTYTCITCSFPLCAPFVTHNHSYISSCSRYLSKSDLQLLM